MTNINSLTNHLLIAMPALNQSSFERAVVYVCEHKEQGAVGLIVNQPMNYHLSFVFEQLNIKSEHNEKNKMPLLYGGPMQPERGFVIHKQMVNDWRSSLMLQDDVTITTSNDIILAIAHNKGPQDVLITLGYSSWGEKQLEKEVIEDAWLICPFKTEILYEVPFNERWNYAGSILGVNMSQLSTETGHA
ncbi:YqgE/AlgH family protein [Legionella israelensis]|uniref:YqgE/AlgH family protein n=1 Tax=Legionella israelensis TaxID=454 RepID=UPI0011814C06|nr:YqgE/AlgH family protein [Legionella israelensis]QDP72240.1 YqgE/AlgH family protein [Legionella israelensis]